MNFDVDPAFAKSRDRLRKRRRARRWQLVGVIGGGAAALLFIVGGLWALLVRGPADDPTTVAQDAAAVDVSDAEGGQAVSGDGDVLVQIEIADQDRTQAVAASFINLRRDPMVLHFEQGAAQRGTSLPGPDELDPRRVGPISPRRLVLFQDDLLQKEAQLVTTIPSSREDFAFFQAQRARALDVPPATSFQSAEPLPEIAEKGELVSFDEGSWGEAIVTGDEEDQADANNVTFVQTQIENTTSVVLSLPERQRAALYDDLVIVAQRDRTLADMLQSNGFSDDQAQRIVRAVAATDRAAGTDLMSGSVLAMRLRPGQNGAPTELIQLTIYGPNGHELSLAQVGAGRFEQGADPWYGEDLLGRSSELRQQSATQQADVRLLDALYTAGLRNGLPASLVGETIVMMSRLFDLEGFASKDDKLTMLYAPEPAGEGEGAAQILYVGIDAAAGKMACYVAHVDEPVPYACFDFNRPGASGGTGLGGGLVTPVNGTRTSGFGPRVHPVLGTLRNHGGVDWAAPTGTPIVAAGPGRISRADRSESYGNVVYIDHGNGVQTRYAHMDRFAPAARHGNQVSGGELIGYVGTTGRSTGPHLHFEVRVNGTAVDPMTFVGVGAQVQVASSSSGAASGAVEALVNQIIRVESAGNANAKNPLSTATGLGQFIESTWLRMMRTYRPDLVQTMSRAQLLALRTNPELSREMVRNLARENEAFLRARGHQITPGRLYLAHFLGPAGASKALFADPNQTVLSAMGSGVVNANPFLRGKTIAYLRNWSDRKMRGASSAPVAVASSAPAQPRPAPIPENVRKFKEIVDGMLKTL